jgi:hypothetical protein
VEDEDPVGGAHAREAVRDEQHRPAGEQRPDGGEELRLGAGVQRGRRLAEDDERGVAGKDACERKPLPLADGEVGAALEGGPEHRLVALRQALEVGVRARPLGRGADRCVVAAALVAAERDVLARGSA